MGSAMVEGARVRRVGILLAAMLAATPLVNAQPTTPPRFETFTATTTNLATGSGEAIKINVFKWATDEERGKLMAGLTEKGDKRLLEAVESAPSAGYVWTSESLGYPIRYVVTVPLPSGGERIVVLTDRRLGAWSGAPWKASNDPNDYPYTLIELRLSRSGSGEGKMSLAAKVGPDAAARTVALENYDSAPVTLKSAKRETARGATN